MEISERLKTLNQATNKIKEDEFYELSTKTGRSEEMLMGNMREMNYLHDKVSKLMRMLTENYDLIWVCLFIEKLFRTWP